MKPKQFHKLKCIFFGTPDFSLPALEMLYNHPYIDLKEVVTMPDRPAGRGQQLASPPVAVFAKENKIKLTQTENINRETDIVKRYEAEEIDLFIVLAFAQFLGSKLLSIPKLGSFNIHTSLLPKYRGAAPIQYALLNGDSVTGVTIQKMVKEMDAGDIVHSFEVPISSDETGGQLYTRLKFQAALSLNSFILDVVSNNINSTAQNHSQATFAPTLKKDDGRIDFQKETFQQIFNKVRALKPWPGTFSFLNGKRLKIIEIELINKEHVGFLLRPGELSIKQEMLIIGCMNSSMVRLKSVQIEGKSVCTDKELINGLKNSKAEIIIS